MLHGTEWNSEVANPRQDWLRREIEGNTVADEPGDLGAILKRIDELLELNQMTMRQASLLAVGPGEKIGNPDYIRNMKRQYEGKIVIKDGVMNDGRIVARQVTAYTDAGAYSRHSPYGAQKAAAELILALTEPGHGRPHWQGEQDPLVLLPCR